MTTTTKTLIQGLWPLPGGNNRYLATLDQVVKWATSASGRTADDLADWFMTQYNVGKGTVSGYVQVVTKLEAVEIENGEVQVGPLGQKILRAEGDGKARVVIERFMSDYMAFPEVLSVYAHADGPLHLTEMVERLMPAFPKWTSSAQYEYRALWLLSLGCLRQVKGRTYEITDLGKEFAARFPPGTEIPVQPTVQPEPVTAVTPVTATTISQVDELIAELEAGATDGQHPDRLERAVAEAFEFLGFAVDQLGDAGDTDVLVRANVGVHSYTVVVDAKARKDGKLQDLSVYTLKDHLAKNKADYAVVVAGSFAGGQVSRHAKDNGIVLIRVPVLSEWLRLHASTPLNMYEYRVAFQTPGILDTLPAAILTASENRKYWSRLLVDLAELIRETYEHGLSDTLPSNQLFTMLVTRLRGVRYSSQDVKLAVQLMSHPALSAVLGDSDTGISLAMNRETLVRSLRALADHIEQSEAEIEA